MVQGRAMSISATPFPGEGVLLLRTHTVLCNTPLSWEWAVQLSITILALHIFLSCGTLNPHFDFWAETHRSVVTYLA